MRRKVLFSTLLLLALSCSTAFAQWGQPRDPFPGKTLKEAYKDYFMIGVAVNKRNVSDAQQAALVKQEFSSMTAENDMAPQPEGAGSAAFQIRHKNPPKAYTLSGDQRGRHL